MGRPRYAVLDGRGLIAVTGPEARAFLQGLASNDIDRVAADRAIHAALLTPQGKYLHDFFISRHGEAFCLDCEAARRPDLMRRLRMYRLRAKLEIAEVEGLVVAALFGAGALELLGLAAEPGQATAFGGGFAYIDPRLVAMGARAVLPAAAAEAACAAAGFEAAGAADYDALRLGHGLPDGSRDLVVEKAVLMESNFEELNGLDWDKGCYVGQEVTARMKYRGLVRKRLVPVDIEGPPPAPDSALMLGEREAGRMRSASGGRGLALLKLALVEEALAAGTPFTAGAARLFPRKPDWAAF